MSHIFDIHPSSAETFDSTHLNDFVEAFESLERNNAQPTAEAAVYFFYGLQPPYFFPKPIEDHRGSEPIEEVTVHTDREGNNKNSLRISFAQPDGVSLELSRSADDAQIDFPFVLTREIAGKDRDTLLDVVEPPEVARFLAGLALGAENRRLLALYEQTEKEAHFSRDPQSDKYFDLIAAELKDRADHSEFSRHYQFPLQTKQGGKQTVGIETTTTSAGHNEYELELIGHDVDGDLRRDVWMSLALSHDYARYTKPTFEVTGRVKTTQPLSHLEDDVEESEVRLDPMFVSAFSLEAIRSIIPPAVPVEPLRRFQV